MAYSIALFLSFWIDRAIIMVTESLKQYIFIIFKLSLSTNHTPWLDQSRNMLTSRDEDENEDEIWVPVFCENTLKIYNTDN